MTSLSELFTVRLTAAELALLDGQCRAEVQADVESAKMALALADSDLTPGQRKLVAEAVAEATKHGLLVYRGKWITSCSVCGKQGVYARYKSGRNRGRENYDKPLGFNGIELAERFVTMRGHASLGGCDECVSKVRTTLVEALRSVRAELPENLRSTDSPRFKRYASAECTSCGWTGHEGQMTPVRALFEGYYPGGCPKCCAKNEPFGKIIIETDSSKWVAVEVAS